jgi:hypothetical protein
VSVGEELQYTRAYSYIPRSVHLRDSVCIVWCFFSEAIEKRRQKRMELGETVDGQVNIRAEAVGLVSELLRGMDRDLLLVMRSTFVFSLSLVTLYAVEIVDTCSLT